MAKYTHFVVVSQKHTCPFGVGLLNQGFGETPEKAWENALGQTPIDHPRAKVRRSRWWLCKCDFNYFESEGGYGHCGPACEDPTKDLWDNLDHWSGQS